ncbi:MAG: PAS domain S-box protein [Burkholderiales bacterium]|nr:PAS domain S-box protein [Burkholderiales bacterium]
MKISTRLWLAGVLTATAVAIVGGVLLAATQQVKQEIANNEKAGDILNGVTGLRYLTLEYTLRHEERAKAQWRQRDASLARTLETANVFTGPEAISALTDLRHANKTIDSLFTELIANQHATATNADAPIDGGELETRISGEIANAVQDMIADSVTLSDSTRQGVLAAQQRVNFAIIAFGIVVAIALLATWLLLSRSVIRPLAALRDGAARIGAGNLAHRLDVHTRDEMGDLAHAFDEMAAKLQGTTVSRDELEASNTLLQAEMKERKQLEFAREQLAAIVDSSDDAIMGKSLEGAIYSWNSGAERLFGYAADEVMGKPMLMMFPPDRKTEEQDILRQVSAGHSVSHLETVRLSKDGRHVDVSVTISPIRDREGKIVGVSTIARDNTEKIRAAAKLHAQLTRLDLINQITRATGERQDLQSIFQVVVRSIEDDLPVDFCCICMHERGSEWLTVAHVGVHSGQLADELALTEHSRVMIDANGLSKCLAGQLVYEPNILEIAMPFPQRLSHGGLRSVVMAPLQVESQVFGLIVAGRQQKDGFSSGECEFLRQLSEHVALAAHQAQLHGALQQAYDDLRQTQQAVMQQERLRALGQMASGIAHDINNAISPVALYTEALLEQETGMSSRARNYLETIQRAIDDVAKTVLRMKEFYRPREPHLAFAAVDVNELIPQVVDLTRARWSDIPMQRGTVIKLETELTPHAAAIYGVASEIREALINLIFNAVDAMPDGGTLTIRTATLERGLNGTATDHVAIEVSDSGIGMDEDTRIRCLEPFFTTKGERGTGLGLAMVYGVMQRHNSEVEIESALGRGTTMRLVLPIYHPTVTDTQANSTPPRISLPRHILVVDDDPLLLKSLADTLQIDGHHVTVANGGQAGIDAFDASIRHGQRFDVVITDLGMPNVDGRKVASVIKMMSESTPVIMLTGWGQRLVTNGDIPEHVDRVLSKPPKLRDLREALLGCVMEQSQ